jgi:hypothetical protein
MTQFTCIRGAWVGITEGKEKEEIGGEGKGEGR